MIGISATVLVLTTHKKRNKSCRQTPLVTAGGVFFQRITMTWEEKQTRGRKYLVTVRKGVKLTVVRVTGGYFWNATIDGEFAPGYLGAPVYLNQEDAQRDAETFADRFKRRK